MSKEQLPEVIGGYEDFLKELTQSIRHAQLRAGLAVNRELILLYWHIGNKIHEQQKVEGWGTKVIDQLAGDLRRTFPDIKGFSSRNLQYMRTFAEAYPDQNFVQQVAGNITWYHNCTLLDKVRKSPERNWYAIQTIEHGWTRDVMVHQIESNLYARQGRAITNFQSTLPKPQSELAQQILKDPYNFDFLAAGTDMLERGLEKGLLNRLRDFLLELGAGFSFVGSQYHLEVGGQDFYIDLLFYHLRMRCYVVVDLKVTDFRPEYAGKMGFYLAAVDDLLRHKDDQPSIGLILCKTNNRVVAEYTLRSATNPVGVSEYKLAEALPEALSHELPTIEKLEKELGSHLADEHILPDSGKLNDEPEQPKD
ncbi:MAG: PDDEXK nuclease domain-containing protein [Candidatus Obscuribacterales bacterium]|nr:PDDEXK nuclease domain-containing protein [Candidatus Obscuribacterales bacterium]